MKKLIFSHIQDAGFRKNVLKKIRIWQVSGFDFPTRLNNHRFFFPSPRQGEDKKTHNDKPYTVPGHYR